MKSSDKSKLVHSSVVMHNRVYHHDLYKKQSFDIPKTNDRTNSNLHISIDKQLTQLDSIVKSRSDVPLPYQKRLHHRQRVPDSIIKLFFPKSGKKFLTHKQNLAHSKNVYRTDADVEYDLIDIGKGSWHENYGGSGKQGLRTVTKSSEAEEIHEVPLTATGTRRNVVKANWRSKGKHSNKSHIAKNYLENSSESASDRSTKSKSKSDNTDAETMVASKQLRHDTRKSNWHSSHLISIAGHENAINRNLNISNITQSGETVAGCNISKADSIESSVHPNITAARHESTINNEDSASDATNSSDTSGTSNENISSNTATANSTVHTRNANHTSNTSTQSLTYDNGYSSIKREGRNTSLINSTVSNSTSALKLVDYRITFGSNATNKSSESETTDEVQANITPNVDNVLQNNTCDDVIGKVNAAFDLPLTESNNSEYNTSFNSTNWSEETSDVNNDTSTQDNSSSFSRSNNDTETKVETFMSNTTSNVVKNLKNPPIFDGKKSWHSNFSQSKSTGLYLVPKQSKRVLDLSTAITRPIFDTEPSKDVTGSTRSDPYTNVGETEESSHNRGIMPDIDILKNVIVSIENMPPAMDVRKLDSTGHHEVESEDLNSNLQDMPPSMDVRKLDSTKHNEVESEDLNSNLQDDNDSSEKCRRSFVKKSSSKGERQIISHPECNDNSGGIEHMLSDAISSVSHALSSFPDSDDIHSNALGPIPLEATAKMDLHPDDTHSPADELIYNGKDEHEVAVGSNMPMDLNSFGQSLNGLYEHISSIADHTSSYADHALYATFPFNYNSVRSTTNGLLLPEENYNGIDWHGTFHAPRPPESNNAESEKDIEDLSDPFAHPGVGKPINSLHQDTHHVFNEHGALLGGLHMHGNTDGLLLGGLHMHGNADPIHLGGLDAHTDADSFHGASSSLEFGQHHLGALDGGHSLLNTAYSLSGHDGSLPYIGNTGLDSHLADPNLGGLGKFTNYLCKTVKYYLVRSRLF